MVLVGERVLAIPPHGCRRRLRRIKKSSQTSGKTKGETCQTDPVKKFFACSPKAYKHKDYEKWQAKFRSYNQNRSS